MLAAIFLLPLAIDVATRGSRGNLAAIFGRLAANAQEPMSIGQSLLFFFSFPIASRQHDRLLTTVGPETWRFLLANLPAIVCWAAVLVGPSLLAWRLRRRLELAERRFFACATALLVVAVGCCIVWGLAQSGGIRHYNGFFYQGIYFFAGLLGVALAAGALEERWRTRLSFVAVSVAVVVAAYALRGRPVSNEERGLPIRAGVTAALAHDGGRKPKLLIFDRNGWHVGAAVGLELTRRGFDCYVPPWWTYMFQRRRDAAQLGEDLEERTETWWVAPSAPGGVPLTTELALFRSPAAVSPENGAMAFEAGGNGFRHLVTGLTDADPEGIPRTNERRLVLRFSPERTTADVRVTFEAEADGAGRRASSADVWFGGTAVGSVEVGDRGRFSVVVPAALWNAQPVTTLVLRFPGAIPQRSAVRPAYEGWSAWRLWKIEFGRP